MSFAPDPGTLRRSIVRARAGRPNSRGRRRPARAGRGYMSRASATSTVPPETRIGQPRAFFCASARLVASIRL